MRTEDTVFLTEMMMMMKYILWYSQISCVFSQQIAIIIPAAAIQYWTCPSFIAFLFRNLVIIKYFSNLARNYNCSIVE